MDLSTGDVVLLIGGEDTWGNYSFISLSPIANKVIYVPVTGKLVIWDLGSNRERTGYAALDSYNLVNTFIWSVDETKIVFAMVRNAGSIRTFQRIRSSRWITGCWTQRPEK
jgi:hypothetical protein